MVQLRNRRIVIDDKPVLIFAGEIHYFRLQKHEWEDRIVKLKALGANAVASYIPWLIHEEVEGDFDVTGRYRPENDVAAFIDLCHHHGLYFIPRPGPFIMAEMKNEGIPYWVYKKHPEAIPTSWAGEKATSKTLDFMSPGFLKAAERWYSVIMPLIAPRLQQKGGPVIGVQLDNEIGMLSWVTNHPDLSDDLLCDFSGWLALRYSAEDLKARYPFDLNDPAPRAKSIRNPAEVYAAALHRDLGDFERHRIAEYVKALRGFAEANGVRDVPFIINIHGTGGGRSTPYPIGIHQLYEAYTQDEGYLSGSDHYLAEITRENGQDVHYMNAFMAAVNRPEQPLTSMEFEVGSGDYGETGGMRYTGAAADFKVRICIAQGNRLLNYYLAAGGRNPKLRVPVGDGNDRVAFTGERHGFAAPINPEGHLDPTYHSLKETTLAMKAVAPYLADMDEEHDGIGLAFMPDYYKTDFFQPGPMQQIVRSLEGARWALEGVTRAMLFSGFRYTAHDIQNRPLDPSTLPALVVPCARLLDGPVQKKLADYVRAGGNLFLFGEFPTFDLENKPCTLLAEAFGLVPDTRLEANGDFHLSLTGVDWAKGEPEVRVGNAQTFKEPGAGVFSRITHTGAPCGILRSVGRGRVAVLPCNYPLHPSVFEGIFSRLGAVPGVRHNAIGGGVLSFTMGNQRGERFLTVINLDLEEKDLGFREHGDPMFGGRPLHLPGKSARLLPLNFQFDGLKLHWSTAELVEVGARYLRFRPTASGEELLVSGARHVTIDGGTQEVSNEHIRIRLLPGTTAPTVRW